MHVNKTKFERHSSLEYCHMTCTGKTKHTQAKEVYFVPSTNSVNSQDGGPCHVVSKFMMVWQGQGLKMHCGLNKPLLLQVRENTKTIDFFEIMDCKHKRKPFSINKLLGVGYI